MSDIEKIQGRDILRLFRELQNDSALLKVYLPDNDFKYLTRIADIQTRKKVTYFVIDYPEGDNDSIKFLNAGSMEFEFTGKDEVKYAFRSAAEQVFTKKIWLQLPSVVEREQRRRQALHDAQRRNRDVHGHLRDPAHDLQQRLRGGGGRPRRR